MGLDMLSLKPVFCKKKSGPIGEKRFSFLDSARKTVPETAMLALVTWKHFLTQPSVIIINVQCWQGQILLFFMKSLVK